MGYLHVSLYGKTRVAPTSHRDLFQLQKFSLLGSTGSIGTQTLDIVREHNQKFEIVALAAGRNLELIAGN